jgi:7,8-dihydropterin-6-yl-methyl-4-(beta-D-ribofuranosyl)aminobenzene 5'-phosphate synthase
MTKSWAQITITYDNNPYDDRLRAAWGLSCVIKLTERVILFDSGGDGAILLSNMERLGIDPKEIDLVVLSHTHGDHVGGLASFLGRHSDVTVYMPTSFTRRLKDEVRRSGARLEEVSEARELFDEVFTTGEIDGGIKEQSLVLKTPQELVVVTGCAHPGVVNIVRKAKEICHDKVYLILGGFHLGGASGSTIEAIIKDFVELGVQRVVPCHCSGERARRLVREHLGPDYVECGVGSTIWIPG